MACRPIGVSQTMIEALTLTDTRDPDGHARAGRWLWDHEESERHDVAVPVGSSMKRSTILQLLSEHLTEVRQRFGVSKLALFGSAARDEMRADSDIDVLVEFEGGTTFARYFDLQAYLEAVFGRNVDLVTEKGLKTRARRHVEKDLIRVA